MLLVGLVAHKPNLHNKSITLLPAPLSLYIYIYIYTQPRHTSNYTISQLAEVLVLGLQQLHQRRRKQCLRLGKYLALRRFPWHAPLHSAEVAELVRRGEHLEVAVEALATRLALLCVVVILLFVWLFGCLFNRVVIDKDRECRCKN